MTWHRKNYWKGIAAGFVATIVLSAIMFMKGRMGIMPELDPIQMLGNMVGGGSRTVGWVMHFMIGAVAWGLLFTAIFGAAANGFWWRGIVFAIGAWLGMMIVVMPMAGAGLFGMNLGPMAPIMTLIVHIIYGWVLGATYAALVKHEPSDSARATRLAP
ncbi:MAG: DUF6789 family protein [Betaproteobacteria bacterium]